MFAAQLLAALLEAATAVIELVSLLKGRKSPEGSETDTGREEQRHTDGTKKAISSQLMA